MNQVILAPVCTPTPVLELAGAQIWYGGSPRPLVRDVSLRIEAGQILGLVGESGCGKTTTARALLGLVPMQQGRVLLHGKIARPNTPSYRRSVRAVFQDPSGSFNPKRSVLDSVAEPLRVAGTSSRSERRKRALEELDRVGISEVQAHRYPQELSGGQCQRAAIARATIVRPEVLICDEPVSALDVSIQAQILELLDELRTTSGIAMLFISHDLAVVGSLCDRTLVMYAGRILEEGPAQAVAIRQRHPYSVVLHDSIPDFGRQRVSTRLVPTKPPDDADARASAGCVYAAVCPVAAEDCRVALPELVEVGSDHSVACFHPYSDTVDVSR